MISIKFIYDSVVNDLVNITENGNMTFPMFNRCSKRAELRMVDYITGDVEGVKPPEMYTTEKVKEWVSSIIEAEAKYISDGFFEKPEGYYRIDNMYFVGDRTDKDCKAVDETFVKGVYGGEIEMVGGKEFYRRINSSIVGQSPTYQKPICKMVGDGFVFAPKDAGMVALEYVRYPKYARIVSMVDPVFYKEVIDEVASTDYEYSEFATDLLIYFMIESFAYYTREPELLGINRAVGKLARDAK